MLAALAGQDPDNELENLPEWAQLVIKRINTVPALNFDNDFGDVEEDKEDSAELS